MSHKLLARVGLVALLSALLLPWSAGAQAAGGAGPLVTVTVTAVGHKGTDPTSVTKEDVLVRQKDDRRPVVGWTPAESDKASLDLVILIDDSL
ncbi:MAG: hypothetical protein ACRD4T_10950, partial [Candidatus Acidiferrales bacterium]